MKGSLSQRKVVHFAIMATILLLSRGAAPEPPAAPINISAVQYTGVTFVACKGVDATARPAVPTDVADSFTILDDMVILFFKIEFGNKSSVTGPFRITIKAFDPQGASFGEHHKDVEYAGEGYVWIWQTDWWSLGAPSELSTGEWRAEAYMGDTLVSSLKFTIQAPEPYTFLTCTSLDKWAVPPTGVREYFNATTDKQVTIYFKMNTRKGRAPVTIKVLDPEGKVFSEMVSWALGSGWDWACPVPPEASSSPDKCSNPLNVAKMAPGNWSAEAYVDDKIVATLKFALYPRIPHVFLARPIEINKPETLYPGDTYTIKYSWKNDGGSTAKDVQMRVSQLQGLTLVNQTGPKDLPAGSTDMWIVQVKANQPGEYNFTVQAIVPNYSVYTYGLHVSERPFSEQYGLYIGTAIVIVILLAAVLVLMRRRRRPTPPAQPTATAPLGVALPARKFCVACGAPLPPDQQFCGKCGTRQT
jgi:hypothetical protein